MEIRRGRKRREEISMLGVTRQVKGRVGPCE
jgi:hypothetical protein